MPASASIRRAECAGPRRKDFRRQRIESAGMNGQ
jgi:hypothetical protein